MEIVLHIDGLVEYYSDFLNESESNHYFDCLASEIDWEHDQLVMFGQQITTKRKIAWYGDSDYRYTYSNSTKIAKNWTKTLNIISKKLEAYTGERFNACLLNFYKNGSEGMGWHRDNESMMKKHACIASISLGAKRNFVFQHNINKKKHSIELENGSLLLMKGATQDNWKHQLPIRKGIKSPRINLTFRHFIDIKNE